MRLLQVDAFTDEPFAGNPAAVCLLDGPAEPDWMQNVAREMNLSETAFLYSRQNAFSLRWFTPAVEVELCGHATLASAHALWEEGVLDPIESALFDTLSGRLAATRRGDGIEMDFPAEYAQTCLPPPGLLDSLGGVSPVAVARNRFDILIEVADEATVRALRPDFQRLSSVAVRGVMVTARAGNELVASGIDFVSRFFAPAVGVDEDPVTGSAHCCLGPWWASRLGTDDLLGRQVSERGGTVGVRVRSDRVLLAGRAVTVLRGELLG
ncbi:MAG: PhzF family phenazine biosynthesis protein [Gemmatimonadota bacterium]|jgi:predicted PhzF superfamily epimerase YddE/YHI9